MIVQTVIQVTFDWQRLVQELFVEIFLGVLTHQNAFRIVVVEWAICASDHLKNIRDWIILVAVKFSVVILSVHDDNKVGSDVQTPCKFTSDNGDLKSI